MRFPALLLCLLSALPLSAAPPAATQVKPGIRSNISFQGSIPLVGDDQYRMRLGDPDTPRPYDISRESFEVLLPKNYKEGEAYGLLVWISPGSRPAISPEWEKVLADEKIIFIGAVNAGNNRETPDRVRLAVDANHHMRERYNIDPARVYVSGHSGGARVASMVGVAYADMFTGAACFMGVNYFRSTQGKGGVAYERRYFPHPEIATAARDEGRFALITGDKDSNLDNTRTIYEQGFQTDKFKTAKLFVIPNQGHNPPDAKWLEKVIQFLDTGK